jgi:hypothetical protein
MSDLDQMEADVLRRLEMLSEGGTLDLERPSLHRVHPGSTVPPGVREHIEAHLCPDVSLWAYHQHRLNQRRESAVYVRLTAIAEAERDLETSLKRPPSYIEPDSNQNAEDRDEAILRWEGKPAEVAAVFEHCSFSHVRKLRRMHKRKPNDGMPILETVAA